MLLDLQISKTVLMYITILVIYLFNGSCNTLESKKTVVRMTGKEADSRIQVFPHFFKIHFISLFLQEKVKSTNNVQHVFCSEPFLTEAAHTLSSESGTITLLMRATLSISASSRLPGL